MKLFKQFSLLGVFTLAILATGCSNDDFQEIEKKSSETITITASTPTEGGQTRVAFDKDHFSLSWKVGDKFQVYGADVAGETFTCGLLEGGKGRFTGVDPQLATKYAFYPAGKTNKVGEKGYDNASFDYTGQIQVGNDNVDELANYMYMTGTVAPDNTVSDFVLHASILKLTIEMPAGFTGEVSQVDVQFETAQMKAKHFRRKAMQDSDAVTSSLSVSLSGVTLADGEQLVVYMAMSPLNVSEDKFTLTVTDASNNKYVRSLDNFSYNFEAGKVVPGLFSVEKQYEDLVSIQEARQFYVDQNTTSSKVYTKKVLGVVVAKIGGKAFIQDLTSGLYVEQNLPDEIVQGDNVVATLSRLDESGDRLEAFYSSIESVSQKRIQLDEVLTERTIHELNTIEVNDVSKDNRLNVPVYTVIRGVTFSSANLVKGEKIFQGGDELNIYANVYEGAVPGGTCDVYGVNYYSSTQQNFIITNVVSNGPYISLSATSQVGIAIDGTEKPVVLVNSNVSWSAQVDGGATLSIGDDEITVTLPLNDTGADKIYTLTVTSTEDESLIETIQLTQDGPYINDLTADRTTGILADGSFEPTITVDANVSWVAEVTNGALLLSDVQGGRIIVTFPENTTSQEVVYTVTVTSLDGSIEKSIDFVQVVAGAGQPGAVNGTSLSWRMTDGTAADLVRSIAVDDWVATMTFTDVWGYNMYSSGFKVMKSTSSSSHDENGYFEIEVPVQNLSAGTNVEVYMRPDTDGGGPTYMYVACSFDDGVTFGSMPESSDQYVFDSDNNYYYIGKGASGKKSDRDHTFILTTADSIENTNVKIRVYYFGNSSGGGVYVSKKNVVSVTFSN